MKAIETVFARWHDSRTALNDGATQAQFHELEGMLGGSLPDDVRAFYARANGMPDFSADSHMVCFWSIERMRTEADARKIDGLAFADFSIDAHRFIFRKTKNGFSVFSNNVAPGSGLEEIGSFSTFLNLYLTDPESLKIF
jgi:hypothetical protein